MTAPSTSTGNAPGQTRWWVARDYLRPTRFGEPALAGVVRAVRPVIGLGAARRHIGGPTYFTSRRKALAFAHAQARRTDGTHRPRKDRP
ncbi:hypothetical protein [Microbacterium sp.]|uniref:hypothetical protein n=1 Tax=Microbacterium sp. TaxID=51671 RepID=UPI002812379E|nr:hypothetical protein [Microbacterium sp.]